MTTTPEQIEAVARAMKDAAVVWLYENPTMRPENIPYEMLALVAINTMRPFIRAEALEKAAKLIEDHTPRYAEGDFQGHLVKRMAFDSIGLPYAAAIRALKDNP
jgi:capsule polysaccharide modification protein KpsS